MSVEIRVDTKELARAESSLSALASSLENRKCRLSITRSRGDIVTNLNNAADQLNQIASILAVLVKNTNRAVAQTRISFEKTDNEIAGWFMGQSNEGD